MANPWALETCCDTLEITFLCVFAAYLVINFFLWNTFILKPMKLIAVFVHELGHATMCWLTGGQVKGIEVYTNEGGVTKYTGGIRLCVIPAGYLGGALFGGFFVAMCGDRIASTVCASVFVFSLIVSLFYSPNGVLVGLSIGFALVTAVFIFIEWFVWGPILQFVVLYYGVTIGTFSVYDIYDDLITRTVDGSDAKACHDLIPCCLPRCE
mmetsp:Transcript_22342/g.25888  ORF Transcript_22342/g.25888 Transcript_22342/m.25888 type:complete len:210 (+) Transcript_22342:143-772(+)